MWMVGGGDKFKKIPRLIRKWLFLACTWKNPVQHWSQCVPEFFLVHAKNISSFVLITDSFGPTIAFFLKSVTDCTFCLQQKQKGVVVDGLEHMRRYISTVLELQPADHEALKFIFYFLNNLIELKNCKNKNLKKSDFYTKKIFWIF